MNNEIDINVPDNTDNVEFTIVGEYIVFLGKHYDESPENPGEWDDTKMHSLSTRHSNFNRECMDLVNPEDEGVPLSYFEHGLCKWGVAGTMSNMPDARWDAVDMAGVWEPSEYVKEEATNLGLTKGSPERATWLTERAEAFCEVYTDWCNGNVYGYTAKIYRVRTYEDGVFDEKDDYRHDDPVYDDSCWGYYGYEDIDKRVDEVVKEIKQELAKLVEGKEGCSSEA